jgi:uncharacterized DUF497 family protein
MDDPTGDLPQSRRIVEWDAAKNEINLQKHGFDFADAPYIFAGPMLVERDDRDEYAEERWRGIGWLHARVVVIVFSEPAPRTIRVISLRKANRSERRKLEAYFENRLG